MGIKFKTRQHQRQSCREAGKLRTAAVEAYMDCCCDPCCSELELKGAEVAAKSARAHHIRILDSEVDPEVEGIEDDTNYDYFDY